MGTCYDVLIEVRYEGATMWDAYCSGDDAVAMSWTWQNVTEPNS